MRHANILISTLPARTRFPVRAVRAVRAPARRSLIAITFHYCRSLVSSPIGCRLAAAAAGRPGLEGDPRPEPHLHIWRAHTSAGARRLASSAPGGRLCERARDLLSNNCAPGILLCNPGGRHPSGASGGKVRADGAAGGSASASERWGEMGRDGGAPLMIGARHCCAVRVAKESWPGAPFQAPGRISSGPPARIDRFRPTGAASSFVRAGRLAATLET